MIKKYRRDKLSSALVTMLPARLSDLYPYSYDVKGAFFHETKILDLGDSEKFFRILFDRFGRAVDPRAHLYQSDCVLLYRKGPQTRIRCSMDIQDITPKLIGKTSVLPSDPDFNLLRVICSELESTSHRFISYTTGEALFYLEVTDFAECRLYAFSDEHK